MIRKRILTSVLLSVSVVFAGGEQTVDLSDVQPVQVSDTRHVIVKFSDDARVRLRATGFVSLDGRDTVPLKTLLTTFGDPTAVRLFASNEVAIDRRVETARARSGRKLADLNSYYEISVDPGEAAALIEALEALDVVQTAYLAPLPMPPPVDIPPTTPVFESSQVYLDPAPDGIDARLAWGVPGGRGDGVTIIDVEYDWNETHEDLEDLQGQELCFTPNGNFTNHGTAVMGELSGEDNGYGVTGIVPDATVAGVTQDPVGMSNSVSRAVECATGLLGPGDVILMETQSSGPLGLLPSEWNLSVFDAVSVATALGITVVSAAGNGNVDLDDPAHGGLFDRNVRDSLAIIVGAGAAPNTGQPARSRLSFSTYGSRVDVQGYGGSVTTTGYGGLFDGGGDEDQFYTSTFSGTSSASPIVAGAVAALQGAQLGRGAAPYDPATLRALLSSTGTPQQSGPFTGNIGPLPDLAQALSQLSDLFLIDIEVDDAGPLGNGDQDLDPGETAVLHLTVKNFGNQTATNVTGLLTAEEGFAVITTAQGSWPDLAVGQAEESLPDHHAVTVQPGPGCGDSAKFSLALSSDQFSNEAVFTLRLGQPSNLDYDSTDTPLEIPIRDMFGVTSTLSIPDDLDVADVQVSVDIDHGDISEFTMVLTSPGGTSVTLHDVTGAGVSGLDTTYDRDTAPESGSMDDFDNESPQGDWTLHIVDMVGPLIPPGTLNSWSLEFITSACNPLTCGDPVPAAVGSTLTVDRAGTDLTFDWDAVSGAAEYRVWRSEELPDGLELLTGQTATTQLILSGGVGTEPALSFYDVRAVNSCEWEGP